MGVIPWGFESPLRHHRERRSPDGHRGAPQPARPTRPHGEASLTHDGKFRYPADAPTDPCRAGSTSSARRGTYPDIAAEAREPLVVKLADPLPAKMQLAADLRE